MLPARRSTTDIKPAPRTGQISTVSSSMNCDVCQVLHKGVPGLSKQIVAERHMATHGILIRCSYCGAELVDGASVASHLGYGEYCPGLKAAPKEKAKVAEFMEIVQGSTGLRIRDSRAFLQPVASLQAAGTLRKIKDGSAVDPASYEPDPEIIVPLARRGAPFDDGARADDDGAPAALDVPIRNGFIHLVRLGDDRFTGRSEYYERVFANEPRVPATATYQQFTQNKSDFYRNYFDLAWQEVLRQRREKEKEKEAGKNVQEDELKQEKEAGKKKAGNELKQEKEAGKNVQEDELKQEKEAGKKKAKKEFEVGIKCACCPWSTELAHSRGGGKALTMYLNHFAYNHAGVALVDPDVVALGNGKKQVPLDDLGYPQPRMLAEHIDRFETVEQMETRGKLDPQSPKTRCVINDDGTLVTKGHTGFTDTIVFGLVRPYDASEGTYTETRPGQNDQRLVAVGAMPLDELENEDLEKLTERRNRVKKQEKQEENEQEDEEEEEQEDRISAEDVLLDQTVLLEPGSALPIVIVNVCRTHLLPTKVNDTTKVNEPITISPQGYIMRNGQRDYSSSGSTPLPVSTKVKALSLIRKFHFGSKVTGSRPAVFLMSEASGWQVPLPDMELSTSARRSADINMGSRGKSMRYYGGAAIMHDTKMLDTVGDAHCFATFLHTKGMRSELDAVKREFKPSAVDGAAAASGAAFCIGAFYWPPPGTRGSDSMKAAAAARGETLTTLSVSDVMRHFFAWCDAEPKVDLIGGDWNGGFGKTVGAILPFSVTTNRDSNKEARGNALLEHFKDKFCFGASMTGPTSSSANLDIALVRIDGRLAASKSAGFETEKKQQHKFAAELSPMEAKIIRGVRVIPSATKHVSDHAPVVLRMEPRVEPAVAAAAAAAQEEDDLLQ